MHCAILQHYTTLALQLILVLYLIKDDLVNGINLSVWFNVLNKLFALRFGSKSYF